MPVSGSLPMTSRVSRRACWDLTSRTIAVSTSWIRYLAIATARWSTRRSIDYLFSSWNTVYREMLAASTGRATSLAHELVADDESAARARGSPTVVSWNPDLAVFADGIGLDGACRAAAGRTPRSTRATWRGAAWFPRPSSTTRPGCNSATRSRTTCTPTATSSCIRSRGATVRSPLGDRLINVVWYRNYLQGDDLDDCCSIARTRRRERLGAARLAPRRARRRGARGRDGAATRTDRRSRGCGPRPVRPGRARPRGASHGLRARLFDRRRGVRRSPPRRGGHGQGGGRRVDTPRCAGLPRQRVTNARAAAGSPDSSRSGARCSSEPARSAGDPKWTETGEPVIPN